MSVTVEPARPAPADGVRAGVGRFREVAGSVARPASAIAIGLGTLLVLHGGWISDASATLVEMGFDPDRARLIASLVAAAVIAAVAALAGGQRVIPILAGAGGAAALFGRTFVQESLDASAGSAGGRFDVAGWWLTIAALVALALAVAWAATTLALSIRGGVTAGARTLRAAIRERRPQPGIIRTGVGVVAIAGFLALTPVVADMFNFSPDARMRQGGPPPVALFGGAAAGADPSAGAPAGSSGGSGPRAPTAGGRGSATGSAGTGPGTAGSGSAGASGGPATAGLVVPPAGSGQAAGLSTTSGALPGSSVSRGSISSDRPWMAWRPTGPGSVTTTQFSAPWVGGVLDTLTVSIYLPPGYAASGRSYPVVYEVPWSLSYWDGGVQLPGLLDGLIDGGQIPPVIVLFISAHGGPYPDSECADSADGRERFETFLTSTVVPWADSHLRTIATPAARTLFGFSTGGFCSPNLLFRHPDLFRQAIAISGYYQAGIRSGQTINAWRPFANDPALLAANSPIQTAGGLPAATRQEVFVALSGDPAEPFYGPQMQGFGAALSSAGIPYAWLPTPLGHRWSAVRAELPAALEAVAGRQVAAGVFG